MRQAQQGDTVRVHYRGKLQDGSVVDASFDREPLQFTIGRGEVIPGFEEAVVGMNPGDSRTTELPVEKAFGPYREDKVAVVHKSQLAGQVEPTVGQRLQVRQPDAPPMNVTVTEVTESEVTLDANHPLAGKDLTFDIELVGIV
jgi:peptidylprolyl isomerase